MDNENKDTAIFLYLIVLFGIIGFIIYWFYKPLKDKIKKLIKKQK